MAEDFTDPRQAAHIRNLSPKKLGKTGVDLDNEIQELRGRIEKLEAIAVLASTPAKPAIVATGGKK